MIRRTDNNANVNKCKNTEKIISNEEYFSENLELNRARVALDSPDSILEQSVWSHIQTLIANLGGIQGGKIAVQSLVQNYVGQTAICGLISEWLLDLKVANLTTGSTSGFVSSCTAYSNKQKSLSMLTLPSNMYSRTYHRKQAINYVKTLIENVISKTTISHFTNKGQEHILNLSTCERSFLLEMMNYRQWRCLLINLLEKNRDSALLTYCLQYLSKRGYHREITRITDISDYFDVFHYMLVSELSSIGTTIINGNFEYDSKDKDLRGYCRDPDNNKRNIMCGFDDVVHNFLKTCTATGYTYLYTLEVLNELIHLSRTMFRVKGYESRGKLNSVTKLMERACRKWEKLKEELEQDMISPIFGNFMVSLCPNPLKRKRRVDVALASGDLRYHRRRCVDIGPDTSSNVILHREINRKRCLESSLENLLRRQSMTFRIDSNIADNLLENYNDNSKNRYLGKILNNHPTSVHALLSMLFLPATSCGVDIGNNFKILDIKMKCARLIAESVVDSEERALSQLRADEQFSGISENKPGKNKIPIIGCGKNSECIAKILLEGSQLCDQVDSMAIFNVTKNTESDSSCSVGRKLSYLCAEYAPVAIGFLLWAAERISGEFSQTATYATLSPGILSLARIIADRHPLTRHRVLDISLIFLGHSSIEITYQKAKALKEQSVRLLLWLSTKGLAVEVFDSLQTKMLKSNSSDIDASLFRYFLGGAFEIIRPPLSVPFFRSIGTMLMMKRSIDALKSPYFCSKKKKKILYLLDHFGDVVLEEKSFFNGSTIEDRLLFNSLSNIYRE